MPFTKAKREHMTHMKNMLEASASINLMYTVLDKMQKTQKIDENSKTRPKGDALLKEMLDELSLTNDRVSKTVEIEMDNQEYKIEINQSATGEKTLTLTRELDKGQSSPYKANFSIKNENEAIICTPIIDEKAITMNFEGLFGPQYKQAIGPRGLIPTQKPSPFTMRPILAIALLKYAEHKGNQLSAQDNEDLCALMNLGPALGKTVIQVAIARATVISGEKVCMVVPHSGLVEAMIKDCISNPITQESISTDITDLSKTDKNCFILTVNQLEDLLIRQKMRDKRELSTEETIKVGLKGLKPLNDNEIEPFNEILSNIMIDEAHELEEEQTQDNDFRNRFDTRSDKEKQQAIQLIKEATLNPDKTHMDRPSILLEIKKHGGLFLSGSCIQGINPDSELYLNPIITALMRHAIEWKLLRDADLEQIGVEIDPYSVALISRMFDMTPIEETDTGYNTENDYLPTSLGKSFIYMDDDNIDKVSKKTKETNKLLSTRKFQTIDPLLKNQVQVSIEVSAEKVFKNKLKKTSDLLRNLKNSINELEQHYIKYPKGNQKNDSMVTEQLKDKLTKLYQESLEELKIQETSLKNSLVHEYGPNYYEYFKQKHLSGLKKYQLKVQKEYFPDKPIAEEATPRTIDFDTVFSEVQAKKNKDTNEITGQAITGMALSILINKNIKNYDKYIALNMSRKPLLDTKDTIDKDELSREKIKEMLINGDFKNLNNAEQIAYFDILMNEIKRIQAYNPEQLSALKVRNMTPDELKALDFDEFEILTTGLGATELAHATARNALGLSTTFCASPRFAAGISDKSVLSVFIPINSKTSSFFKPSILAQAVGRAFRSDNLRSLVKFVLGKPVYQKENSPDLSSSKFLIKENENAWEVIMDRIHIGLNEIIEDPTPHFIKQANTPSSKKSSKENASTTVPRRYSATNRETAENLEASYKILSKIIGPKIHHGPRKTNIRKQLEKIIDLEKILAQDLREQSSKNSPSPKETILDKQPNTPPMKRERQHSVLSALGNSFNKRIFFRKNEFIKSDTFKKIEDHRKKLAVTAPNIAAIIAKEIWTTLSDQTSDSSVLPEAYQEIHIPNIKSIRTLLENSDHFSLDQINASIDDLTTLIRLESIDISNENSSDSAHKRSSDESSTDDDYSFKKPIIRTLSINSTRSSQEIQENTQELIELKDKLEGLRDGRTTNPKSGPK